MYTIQKVYMTRVHVLTRTVDRHGSRARPTNFHRHTSIRCPNSPFAPLAGTWSASAKAHTLRTGAPLLNPATRRGWRASEREARARTLLEVGSHSVSSFVCERHMRTGGRSSVERCSPSAGVDVGNAVGSTASVAQPQRGIEWPAAVVRVALNRRFY